MGCGSLLQRGRQRITICRLCRGDRVSARPHRSRGALPLLSQERGTDGRARAAGAGAGSTPVAAPLCEGGHPGLPGPAWLRRRGESDDAVILEGVDGAQARASLFSTVHGAGRLFGRQEAKRRIAKAEMEAWLQRCGVLLSGADLDESPMAYRRLPDVLAHHAASVKVLHTLRPFSVAMAGDGEFDPWKVEVDPDRRVPAPPARPAAAPTGTESTALAPWPRHSYAIQRCPRNDNIPQAIHWLPQGSRRLADA